MRVRRMVIKEWRQLFRDPKTKRIIFVSPVVQLLMFGYAVNTDVRNVSTILVDHDRTLESRELSDALTRGGYFDIVQTATAPREIERALDRGSATVGVEIPVGFARDTQAGRSVAVRVVVDATNANTATVAMGNAVGILQAYGIRTIAGSRGSVAPRPGIDLGVRAWYNPTLESSMYNVPAVIGAVVTMMSLLLTALSVVREREVGTLDQLLVTPLRPLEFMLGKTIPVAGVALIQLAIVTLVALLWFDVPFRGSVATLLVAAVFFIVAGLSAGLLISTISSTQQEAFLSIFVIIMPVIILSGFLYPVETMPRFFQDLTLINPLAHFLAIVRSIFLKGAGFEEVWPRILALASMAFVGIVLATDRFKRTLG